ncbi:MAG: alpha/beta hydrolase fold domain-containing protein [Rhodospirillaceae bacterium]|nr:alpha/beta hydrolase fold domain-containing protein [Rhodospirillaceae bacterium]
MAQAIDPEIKLFVDGVAAAYARHPNVMTVPYDQGRAIVEEVRRPWRDGGPPMASSEDRVLSLPCGPLRIRIHRPTVHKNQAALVYLHGGGFTFFSIDTHDRVMREYAARASVTVIGADYPLSPEAKFPAALERIAALMEWLAEHSAEIGIDSGRIAIGGDSAGGNLSVATALLLRDRGKPALIKTMVLNYAGLSPISSEEAKAVFGGEDAILTAAEVDFFWANYLRGPEDKNNPLANVLSADPTGLPPAIFIVAEMDLLAEQSPLMAQRMIAAGGRAVVKTYAGAVHGFIEAAAISALARRGLQDAADWLARELART